MGNIKTPYDRVFIKTDDEITLPEKQALIGQLEKFLYAICAFDFDDLPIPQSRIEKFVFALISGEIPDIVPQSRAEKFLLAYLTGDTSDLPEPQSRIELLLNNLVFGIQDISNVETIQSRYELLMAYLVQHNEGSNVEPTYHTLTIKYVDVNGNELHERYVEENIKTGTIYNVSHLDDEIEIEDYQYVRTDGDKTTGVMTKDREIIVVYKLKEYDLTIKYQDENGNTIHTSYTKTLEKGTSYDVSHLDDEVEIEGYVYLRTDGDSLTGIIDGNKEIIVIYETVVIDIFYNLTIKYVDTNGNEIFNKYEIESIKEGLNYDVSHLDNEIVIDGYKYVKTEGDSLIGIMDENKEITVVYKKLENYNLIIKYQDKIGNTLIDDYEEVIQEDNLYDVSHLDDEVLINGYTYLSVTGDSLSGVMDGNKEIIVIYEINYEYILYDFSEENYTLYNTVEKPVKNAILKGQTLVNVLNPEAISFTGVSNLKMDGGNFTYDVDVEWGKFAYIINGKPNTSYLIKHSEKSDETYIVFRRGVDEHHPTFTTIEEKNQLVTTDGSGQFTISVEAGAGTNFIIRNLMVFEYQDGMENWDIPYFEGIGSVKMPVLKTTGKNLFDGKIERGSYHPSATTKIDSDKTRCRSNIAPLIPDGFKGRATISEGFLFYLRLFKNGKVVKESGFSTFYTLDNTSNTFSEVTIVIRKVDNTEITDDELATIKIQIEEGSVGTEYEPFKSNILTTNEEIELRGIGEVKDELDLLTGELTQRVGEFIVDESRTYTYENSYQCFYTPLHEMKKVNDFEFSILSENAKILKEHTYMDTNYSYNGISITGYADWTNRYPNQNWLYLKINNITTVSDLIQYLSENPITVQYQLATESVKTVDLSVVDQDGKKAKLSSFEDITHVTVTSDGLLPDVKLEVATKNKEVLNTMSLEMDDISATQTALEETSNMQSENVDATMMATTEIYEGLL